MTPSCLENGLLNMTLVRFDFNADFQDEASNVLSREGRANTNLLTEEFRVGNLERECNEEVCSWDEAFEIFENEVKTNEFMNSKEQGPTDRPVNSTI